MSENLQPENSAEIGKTGSRRTFFRMIVAFFSILLVAGFFRLRTLVNRARHAAMCGECKCSINWICMLLQNYHDSHGHFPPAYIADENGRPMHSWRVLILFEDLHNNEFIKQYDFNEPWNGPNNRKLADQMPHFYSCPLDEKRRPHETSYLMLTGPGTLFQGDEITSREDCKDDAETTAIVAEMSESAIHWMEPWDLDVRQMSYKVNDYSKPSIRGNLDFGPCIVMAKGWIASIDPETPEPTIKALTTIAGGEKVKQKRYNWFDLDFDKNEKGETNN